MVRPLRHTTDILADLAFIDAPARVAKQEQLAQLVGATRETVNKALSESRNRSWIRVDGNSVLISDPERLALRAH